MFVKIIRDKLCYTFELKEDRIEKKKYNLEIICKHLELGYVWRRNPTTIVDEYYSKKFSVFTEECIFDIMKKYADYCLGNYVKIEFTEKIDDHIIKDIVYNNVDDVDASLHIQIQIKHDFQIFVFDGITLFLKLDRTLTRERMDKIKEENTMRIKEIKMEERKAKKNKINELEKEIAELQELKKKQIVEFRELEKQITELYEFISKNVFTGQEYDANFSIK
jgi:hypothetical protein